MEHTLSALIGGLIGPRTIGAPRRPWLDGPGLTRLAASVAATLAAMLAERDIGARDRKWPAGWACRPR